MASRGNTYQWNVTFSPGPPTSGGVSSSTRCSSSISPSACIGWRLLANLSRIANSVHCNGSRDVDTSASMSARRVV
eukprot:1055755-Prymnesium_polylepis.1